MGWKDRLTEETIEIRSKDQEPLQLAKLHEALEKAASEGKVHGIFDTPTKRIAATFHEKYHTGKYFEIAGRKGIAEPAFITPGRDENGVIDNLRMDYDDSKFTDAENVEIALAPNDRRLGIKPSHGDHHYVRKIRGVNQLPDI